MPSLVEKALDDDRLASTARVHLAQNDKPEAAQMLARIAVRDLALSQSMTDGPVPRQPPETFRILVAREATLRDMSAPLLAITLDGSKPPGERRAALEILARYGDTGAAPHLAPPVSGGDGAEVAPYARAAIEELEGRGNAATARAWRRGNPDARRAPRAAQASARACASPSPPHRISAHRKRGLRWIRRRPSR